MESLPIFLALDGRPAILVGDGPAAGAKRRLLERAGARIVDETGDARIAIVAIEDEADAIAAAERLRPRALVNAVDRPALSDFTMPAIVDRAPVTVAVGTGGASASLAKALRQRIEAMLPAGLGALAEAIRDARAAIHARFPDPADRRRALDAAMAPGAPLDPLGEGDALGRVAAWLNAAGASPAPALVAIRLASADPDDLTLRAARLLGRADRVYHRADVPAAILDRARADADRIACAAPPATPPAGLSLDVALA